jgi:hypothetical protein
MIHVQIIKTQQKQENNCRWCLEGPQSKALLVVHNFIISHTSRMEWLHTGRAHEVFIQNSTGQSKDLSGFL